MLCYLLRKRKPPTTIINPDHTKLTQLPNTVTPTDLPLACWLGSLFIYLVIICCVENLQLFLWLARRSESTTPRDFSKNTSSASLALAFRSAPLRFNFDVSSRRFNLCKWKFWLDLILNFELIIEFIISNYQVLRIHRLVNWVLNFFGQNWV